MVHSDASVDHEAIDLVEGMVVGAVDGFVTERSADGKDAQGWRSGLEDSALEGGALGAEEEIIGDVERILLIHCGVVGRIVEGIEVVFELLEFGRFLVDESH